YLTGIGACRRFRAKWKSLAQSEPYQSDANCDADPYSSRPRNRLDLSTAFEAGRAEVLAWDQAASVPSAGITLQQTDTPFCRGQLAIAGSCAPAPDVARQRGGLSGTKERHRIHRMGGRS